MIQDALKDFSCALALGLALALALALALLDLQFLYNCDNYYWNA